VLAFADAAARLAAPGRALPDLRELCARERFNEQAHARLMLALAATGQQAAALEVFTSLRHRLDQELGIDPGANARQAQAQILRQHGGANSAATPDPGRPG
jgi:DNA-binding SARP family transcriptional activator